jgi:glycine/D-amino acid oxidase-like deaminating enzyme
MASYDAIVVGGGIVGAATAYSLAREGAVAAPRPGTDRAGAHRV